MTALKNKLILTDCDGVLLDWAYGFHKWMKRHKEFLYTPSDSFNIEDNYNMNQEMAEKYIDFFNESADIGWLPPYKDAVHYVNKLHREHGFVFKVITSHTQNPYARRLRKANLFRHFGEAVFDDIISLDRNASKKNELTKYKDTGCFWIEDHPKNYRIGEDLGLTSILMNHNFNQNNFEIRIRVNNWKELYSWIQ